MAAAAVADKGTFWRKGVGVRIIPDIYSYIVYKIGVRCCRLVQRVLSRRRLKVMRSGVRGDRAQL